MPAKNLANVFADYDTVSSVADITDIPRVTIRSAIDRGEIQTYKLAGGKRVISVKAVKTWYRKPRRRGRPPKSR